MEEAVAAGDVTLSAFARLGYPGVQMADDCLPGVCSLGYWDGRKDQNWGLDWHRNEGLEITYLATGKLDFFVRNADYKLKPSQMTITRPWQQHKLGNPNVQACKLYWLILDVGVRRPNSTWDWPDWLILTGEDRERLTSYLKHNEQPVLDGNEEIENCFDRIAKVLEKYTPEESSNRLKLYMNELFVILLEVLTGANLNLDSSLSSSLRTVEYFLDELPKYLDYEWGVDDMAEECGLARSRFSHYCKKLTNLSPLDFLTKLRLQEAMRLLTETEASVQKIAEICGYQSARYFSTKFKKMVGSSPSVYREENGN